VPTDGHFQDCKALLVTSLTHVSSTVSSTCLSVANDQSFSKVPSAQIGGRLLISCTLVTRLHHIRQQTCGVADVLELWTDDKPNINNQRGYGVHDTNERQSAAGSDVLWRDPCKAMGSLFISDGFQRHQLTSACI